MGTQTYLNKRWPPASYASGGSSYTTHGSEQPESVCEGPGKGLGLKTPKGKEALGGVGAFEKQNRDAGKRWPEGEPRNCLFYAWRP